MCGAADAEQEQLHVAEEMEARNGKGREAEISANRQAEGGGP